MEKFINMETYKDILGFEGIYQISNLGNVKNIMKNKVLKPRKHTNGYLRICLCKNGIVKDYFIHRLVASAFIENPLNKSDVNHIDGNKANNNIFNLEWSTRSENQKHAFSIGLNKISEQHKKANAIYNSKQVIDLYTGIFYDSLKNACEITNRNYSVAKTNITRNFSKSRFQYV